jgi:hypothetical protein
MEVKVYTHCLLIVLLVCCGSVLARKMSWNIFSLFCLQNFSLYFGDFPVRFASPAYIHACIHAHTHKRRVPRVARVSRSALPRFIAHTHTHTHTHRIPRVAEFFTAVLLTPMSWSPQRMHMSTLLTGLLTTLSPRHSIRFVPNVQIYVHSLNRAVFEKKRNNLLPTMAIHSACGTTL